MKLLKKMCYLLALAAPWIGDACAQEASLYERLGGRLQVIAAADDIVTHVSSDPRSRRSFDGVALGPLKAKVAEHLCSISGGPCIYSGETMVIAHTGLAITDSEFNIMGDYVHAAFLRQGVKPQDLHELESILEKMRPEVLSR